MTQIPLRYILHPREIVGQNTLEVLSVYRDHGVIPKGSRTDNYNKTPDDLSRYQRVDPGNLVVNKMKAWSGSVAVSEHTGIVSPDYLVCEVSTATHPRFLHHWLRSRPAVAEMRARSRGIRPNQERLYWDDLAAMRIDLPHLEAQRRIAQFLDAQVSLIDRALDLRKRERDLIGERLATQVQHTIVSSGPYLLRSVASMARYINGYPFKPSDFTLTGRPVIRIQQLNDPEAPTDLYDGLADDRHRLRDGDLVFSWSGSLSVAIWRRGDAILNQHLFRVLPALDVDKNWLEHALKAAIELFDPFMHGSTMRHITAPMMKMVRLPLPPLEEQKRLAKILDRAVSETASRQALLDRASLLLEERKQSLITAAVAGQFDVSTARAVA
ncbi:type I restriction enzyme, S subunit [Blastococcus fimeti]|nr:type I restriction enzyme, S subunit [Blastococcus fimeti]